MPFYSPSWVPRLPFDPPKDVPISDFILQDKYGRYPRPDNRPAFTDGVSGKTYSFQDVKERVDLLARGLLKELGWSVNQGDEWSKTVGVFALNTIDTGILAWAIHSLGGIDTPANAAYTKEVGRAERVHPIRSIFADTRPHRS